MGQPVIMQFPSVKIYENFSLENLNDLEFSELEELS